eukprot:3502319-Rhodomonas_salina.1
MWINTLRRKLNAGIPTGAFNSFMRTLLVLYTVSGPSANSIRVGIPRRGDSRKRKKKRRPSTYP